MKMHIKANRGIVTIKYDNILGDRITREFFCPIDGGYVREIVQGEAKQVCKNLSFTGSTLMAASRATLIYVIRFEYQAMKRLQKNER